MDERALLDRLDALCEAADRMRLPGHRFTAEQAMLAQEAVRAGLRRLRHDLDARPAAAPPRPFASARNG